MFVLLIEPHSGRLITQRLQKRNMLRLTAKATQFGHRTFTSWLIESAGTLPIKRRKDHPNGDADNTDVMESLMLVKLLICFEKVAII